ncbi:hypothetical protein EMCRGX_G014167 [Ephydatia muelleri]
MNVFKVSRVPVVRILPIHLCWLTAGPLSSCQVTSDKRPLVTPFSLEVAGSSVRLLFCLYLYWPLRDSRCWCLCIVVYDWLLLVYWFSRFLVLTKNYKKCRQLPLSMKLGSVLKDMQRQFWLKCPKNLQSIN